MKYLFTTTPLIVLFNICFAQKQFEGTISYTLHSNEEKKDAELLVSFGKNGIKLKFREKENFDDEVILVNLDSGKVYTVNVAEKTYRAKKLMVEQKEDMPADKMIAGYKTKAIDISGGSALGAIGGMLGGGKFVVFAADSLLYFV